MSSSPRFIRMPDIPRLRIRILYPVSPSSLNWPVLSRIQSAVWNLPSGWRNNCTCMELRLLDSYSVRPNTNPPTVEKMLSMASSWLSTDSIFVTARFMSIRRVPGSELMLILTRPSSSCGRKVCFCRAMLLIAVINRSTKTPRNSQGRRMAWASNPS